MKCEKCGKNEVNYYYSSNINGKVTEKHLCAECAAEFEKSKDYVASRDMFSEMNSMFDNMFSGMLGRRSLLDPWGDFGFRMPAMFMPRINVMLASPRPLTADGPAAPETEERKVEAEVDPEMNKRRQINALRHEMKMAAHNEEYEKAAELRDKIKALESEEDKAE